MDTDRYSQVRFVKSKNFHDCFVGQKAVINLPDGVVEFTADRVDSKPNGDYYWSGLTDPNSNNQGFFMVSKHNKLGYFGKIHMDGEGKKYDLFSLSPKVIGMFEIAPVVELNQGTCIQPDYTFDPEEEGEDEEDQAIIRSCSGIPVIRVLFLYTNQAGNSAWVPSTTAFRVIELMNQSLEASEAGIAIFELAGTEPLPGFVESTEILDDIDDLFDDNTANQLRDDHLADLVILLTNNFDEYDGINGVTRAEPASDEKAYAIVEISFALNGLTALHEIGHLMGARHQRYLRCPYDNSTCCSKHRAFHVGGTDFNTIMYALACGKDRMLRWSNRYSLVNGRATGNRRNQNTRAFLKNSCDISEFRDSPPDLNMYARINGPGVMYCCSSNETWTAEVYNNPGTPPYTYTWEKSSNGIDNWCNIGINSNTINGPQLSFTGCGCGSSFFLRLTITDNSSPNNVASHQIGVEYVSCLTDDAGDTREKDVQTTVQTKVQSSIRPNPVEDVLYYESDRSSILSIFDLSGKEIGSNYHHKADDLTNIDTSNLPKGAYILVVKSEKNQFIKQHKFIKL